MKKILVAILSCLTILTASVLLAGCGVSFKGTTMKAWGDVKANYGFVSETENYVYYINGLEDSSSVNTFGTPVKASLMVASKNNLEETEIVVPKLFVSSDYTAGFYIYGEGNDTFVYYGTPCTEKNAKGEIASNEMTFMRTRLDGTDTKEFFTVKSLSAEFRFIENNGTVYLVYYDLTDSAIYSYNTATGEKITVAKTQDNVKDSYVSLENYKFLDNKNLDKASVVYTVKVYSENYIVEKAAKDGYARGEANYNEVFVYKVGDTVQSGNETAGTKVLSNENTVYGLSFIDGDTVYYTKTDISQSVYTYRNKVDTLGTEANAEKIVNSSAATAGSIIKGDKAIVIESESSIIVEKDLTSSNTLNDKKITTATGAKLLFENDGYLYFTDADNKIMRVKENTEDKAYRVSKGAIKTTWYSPILIDIEGEDYVFYLDGTTYGDGYLSYINLDDSQTVEASKDTDDDGEDDLFYLTNNKVIGKLLEKDKANKFIEMINDIGDKKLTLEENDQGYFVTEVNELRAEYNSLSEEAKSAVAKSYMKKLGELELAITLANKYKALSNINNYDTMEEADKTALKNAYEEIKEFRISVIEAGEYSLATARDTYIPDDVNYLYYKAQQIFEKD